MGDVRLVDPIMADSKSDAPPGVSTWLVSLGLAGLSVLLAWGAVVVGDGKWGSSPAAVSPRGLLVVASCLALGMAITTVASAAGGRFTRKILGSTSAYKVVGAGSNKDVPAQLRAVTSLTPRYLPAGIALAFTDDGVEVWGSPGATRHVTLPWATFRSVGATTVIPMGSSFTALAFECEPTGKVVAFPLAGLGVVGIRKLSIPAVQVIAAEIMVLKEQIHKN